ncbi:MAG: response regulator [candidate division Zixibacteria bacterium]|nr:response regulator [candidate division Zixibacteria bacterium]
MTRGGAILVFDEDSAILSLLEEYFENLDYETQVAHSAEGALEILRTQSISVAVIGIRTNQTQDMDVIKRLVKIDPDLKIILISGYPTIDSTICAMRYGVFDFIIKPFRLEQLEQIVKSAYRQPCFNMRIKQLEKIVAELESAVST